MPSSHEREKIDEAAAVFKEFLRLKRTPGLRPPLDWATSYPKLYEYAHILSEYNRSDAFDPGIKKAKITSHLKPKLALHRVRAHAELSRLQRKAWIFRKLKREL